MIAPFLFFYYPADRPVPVTGHGPPGQQCARAVKDRLSTSLLQKLMRELTDSQGSIGPLFETAIALEEACEDSLAPNGIYPNVDL